MNAPIPRRTGAQLLVDALHIHGVDLAFGVPGESYLAVLDALYDKRDVMRFVICRQEGGAANMAEAYGKMTGRPGICFVTRGPGACNASIGVHTAFQDSTPLFLFVGQVSNEVAEREAFQEVDYRRMFGPLAKWVAQIDRADRVPEYISHAFHTAVSGRPGPVVLALPEDMQTDVASVPDAGRYQRVAAHPGPTQMHQLRDLLAHAERPVVILGGSGWSVQACEDFKSFVTTFNLPVACSFRAQDLLDNRDPHYVGEVAVGINPKLAERIRASDLLVVIGARLGEWTTLNYSLVDIPRPRQRFVHIHPGAEELGRVYQGDLLINAGMPEFSAAARGLAPVRTLWDEWTEGARADFEAWQKPVAVPG
ncbi:MAG TPA: thiamine pyrophosphate-binding protein, partial [Burkholderiales bacterium]|nr:thiamine pyrophosphate-binding protein [Burkholderiales bacterium]